MKQVQKCPGPETLGAFSRGELSEADSQAIAEHLEACESCWRKVESSPLEPALADDLKWVSELEEQTVVDVNVPLTRLSEALPDYEIIREIGRGGMGIVFEARQVKLDRRVALKVLPALLGAVRPDAVARFRREAALAARLQHTNIIPVHDFGEVEGTFFYCMELVEGCSLRDILREITESGAINVVLEAGSSGGSGSIPVSSTPSAISREEEATRQRGDEATSERHEDGPTSDIRHSTSVTRIGSSSRADRAYYRRVAAWVADVAEALDYAHEQGVIHRDVKPSNLLLATNGRLMISDFGLARARGAETLTATRSLLGTARYMSPEQADESLGAIDRRVDVYGLGATLYELLTFRPMFAAADDREVLDCVLNKEPAPPRRFVRQVPRELETICVKAVEKRRDARYESAKAMADDLRRWLLDLPIHAKPPSMPNRAAKFIRRRKGTSALVALLVVVLGVAGVLYSGYRGSQHEAAEATSAARSQRTELLLLRAREDRNEGRLTAALRTVDAGLAQEPDDFKLLHQRAKLLWDMERRDEALELAQELVAREPENWLGHYLLAGMFRTLDDEQKAGHHRAEVYRLMPETADAYFLRGCEDPDPLRAIELLDQALELEPDHANALYERSRRYHALGDYDKMLVDAERAVTSDSAVWFVHTQHGLALMGLGRYDEAEQAYGRAIKLDPQRAMAWHNRGLAKHGQGRFGEALADAGEAIRLDPEFAEAYACRGKARAGLGELDEALADYGRAIALAPANVEFYIGRAYLCAQAARWPEVIADCTRAMELDPDEPKALWNRGVAYIYIEEYDRAIGDFTRCIVLQPGNFEAYTNRGHAQALKGEYAESIEDYTKAIELNPGVPGGLSSRANLLIHFERYEEAIADLTRLIDREPTRVKVVLRRGMVYELVGAARLALADYDQASERPGPIGEYARLWKYILLRQEGRDQAAASIVTSHSSSDGGTSWPDRLFALFAEESSPDELLDAAVTDDERAEAYYYIARQALLDGQPDDAQEAFTKCIALDRTGVLETDFARARLKQLECKGRGSVGNHASDR